VLLKTHFILLALTEWDLNRFSQFFHCWKPHTTVLRPFFRDQPGQPVPEENF